MPITDVALRTAKAREKPYKISDSGGLFLLVTTSGGKLWRLKYRYGGKEKLLALGAYPVVSLADARSERDAAKKLLVGSLDPSIHRKAAQAATQQRAQETFGVIAEEFIAWVERDGRKAVTMAKLRWLTLDLMAPLIDRPIRDITSAEVLEVLRKVEARGLRESVKRARGAVSRVFRYAMTTGRAEADPTYALPPREVLLRTKVQHHAAITDARAVGELMRAIDGSVGALAVNSALKVLAYCFPRPGTLRLAEWSEFNLDAATWSPPISHMKRGVQHVFPLPSQVVALLRDLKEVTGGGPLVFPGVRSAKRPLSENTLNVALRRLGYTSSQMTSHGFRTTASSLLNESGLWHPDAVERALSHVEANAVRKAYARGEFWDERVRMAQWWADKLDALKLETRVS